MLPLQFRMAIGAAMLLAGCRANDSDRDYTLAINRKPEVVADALSSASRNIPADSIAPYLAGAKIKTERSGADAVVMTVPGDGTSKDITFTFTLTGAQDGKTTELHVVNDIPEKVGVDEGKLHALNGNGYARSLRNEVAAMGQLLANGSGADAAAFSLQMVLHNLAMNNRLSLQRQWAEIERDPKGYAEQVGRDASDHYVDTSNLPPDERERVKGWAHDAMDHANAKGADQPTADANGERPDQPPQ